MGSPKKLKTAVLGGTFDHFHKGHKKLIEYGLSISEKLIIGLTSDEFVDKFKIKNFKLKNSRFENYQLRKKNIEEYLNQNAKREYEIIKINDVFGTTLDKNFPAETIIVSQETIKGAQIINKERLEKNLPPFEIVIQNPVLAEDKKPISSFRIRKGEIDREGKLVINPDWLLKTLYLPLRLRTELKSPLGKFFEKNKIQNLKNNFLITVGDETTKFFNKSSMRPNVAVIDLNVARKKKYKNVKELDFLGNEKVYEIKNPSGSISKELFKAVKIIFENITDQDCIVIKIDGEDDLSVLPLILAAPLGTSIFYGQVGKGIVQVYINEEIKAKTRLFLGKFSTRGY